MFTTGLEFEDNTGSILRTTAEIIGAILRTIGKIVSLLILPLEVDRFISLFVIVQVLISPSTSVMEPLASQSPLKLDV